MKTQKEPPTARILSCGIQTC